MSARGVCVVCGHDPACGYASIFHDGREDWYCHDDDHSCYETHQSLSFGMGTTIYLLRRALSVIDGKHCALCGDVARELARAVGESDTP